MPKNAVPVDPIVVTVDELAGRLGSAPQFVHHWLKKLKLHLVDGHVFDAAPGDEPVQGLPIEQAERFLREVRSNVEQHQSRWDAYVAYRKERLRKAQEDRVRQATEAHRASMEVSRQRAEHYQAAAAEEAARVAAERAAAKAESEGRPVDFDTFVSSS